MSDPETYSPETRAVIALAGRACRDSAQLRDELKAAHDLLNRQADDYLCHVDEIRAAYQKTIWLADRS
jgi:hypothetical protein